jgi:hypothetical protein
VKKFPAQSPSRELCRKSPDSLKKSEEGFATRRNQG